jgi:hypothetical protein
MSICAARCQHSGSLLGRFLAFGTRSPKRRAIRIVGVDPDGTIFRAPMYVPNLFLGRRKNVATPLALEGAAKRRAPAGRRIGRGWHTSWAGESSSAGSTGRSLAVAQAMRSRRPARRRRSRLAPRRLGAARPGRGVPGHLRAGRLVAGRRDAPRHTRHQRLPLHDARRARRGAVGSGPSGGRGARQPSPLVARARGRLLGVERVCVIYCMDADLRPIRSGSTPGPARWIVH